uniref:Uncharacterized protein n=1 Tax=Ascaris lumbricoides TaxID=6252 RepID=A0A0M3IAG4_ASCLU
MDANAKFSCFFPNGTPQLSSSQPSNPYDATGYGSSSNAPGQAPINTLLGQHLALPAPLPILPTAMQNTNARIRGWSTSVSNPRTSPSDDQRYGCRWQMQARDLSPTWLASSSSTRSVVANGSNQHFNSKIVSITYADPSGGSTIVTRRMEDGRLDVRFVYSRDFILAASASPYALLPPANVKQIVYNMMEIVAVFPTSFYNSIRKDDCTQPEH